MLLLDALAGNVGATITKYCVCLSDCDRPMGMNVCVVKGCLSSILISSSCRSKAPLLSSSSSSSRSPQLEGMLWLGSCGLKSRGAQTNIFMTALAGFLLGARL